MTPLQIKMMLHYYAIAEPYAKGDPQHAKSPAVRDQRASLISHEMLMTDESQPSDFSSQKKAERMSMRFAQCRYQSSDGSCRTRRSAAEPSTINATVTNGE